VPIDFEYPDTRIVAMFCAATVKILLTQQLYSNNREKLLSDLIALDVKIIKIDELDINFYMRKKSIKHNSKYHAKNLAYVVFTSGSTGVPKA